ncbi:MAG: hypothetical protein HC906_04410 [Bacteroidales bacterium]|nr:hypothetical protein [Bacteroidales bacterium]
MLLISHSVQGQNAGIKFRHITSNEGLSQGTALCFLQDNTGFIWIGTRDGLNKFDGYSFTVFKNNPDDENSLSNNFVRDLFKDNDGNIWIATWGSGINMYDVNKQKFIRFFQDEEEKLANDFIYSIAQDNEGDIWIGLMGEDFINLIRKQINYSIILTMQINRPACPIITSGLFLPIRKKTSG